MLRFADGIHLNGSGLGDLRDGLGDALRGLGRLVGIRRELLGRVGDEGGGVLNLLRH